MSVGTVSMAKKRSKPRGPVDFGESKPIILAMRGSAEFKNWIERYAQANRTTVAQAVERALAFMASQDKFDPPPKR